MARLRDAVRRRSRGGIGTDVDHDHAERDPPLAVPTLETIEVPAADETDRILAAALGQDQEVRLGVGDVSFDFDEVIRDVMLPTWPVSPARSRSDGSVRIPQAAR